MTEKPDTGTESSPDPLELAIRSVISGEDLPVLKIEDLRLPEESDEAKRCLAITNILKDFAIRKASRPISIAIFGPPGSGKSFCVGQIAMATDCRKANARDGIRSIDGDDTAVDRLRRPIHHEQVAVQNAGIHHRVATRIRNIAALFSIRNSVKSSGVSK
nr:hypothetical protein [Granulicella sp. S190]